MRMRHLRYLLSEVTILSGLTMSMQSKDVAEFLMIRTFHFIQLGIYDEHDDETIWIYGFSKSIEESFALLIGLHE